MNTVIVTMIAGEIEEQPLWYENYDLSEIMTPVNTAMLHKLLNQAGYDREETQFLTEGFKKEFSINYAGPTNIQQNSPNLKLRIGSKVEMWNKLMKEVKLKRVAGPFEKVPFKNYIQSQSA